MNVVIDRPFMNVSAVDPLQQRDVRKLVDACEASPNVKRLILFGSSVSDRCTIASDLDLYFVVKDGNPAYIPFVKTEAEQDIFWNSSHEWSRFKEEICRTGVIVFEREE